MRDYERSGEELEKTKRRRMKREVVEMLHLIKKVMTTEIGSVSGVWFRVTPHILHMIREDMTNLEWLEPDANVSSFIRSSIRLTQGFRGQLASSFLPPVPGARVERTVFNKPPGKPRGYYNLVTSSLGQRLTLESSI